LVRVLEHQLPLPDPILRERLVEAVKQLLTLQAAATDPANPHLPAVLRADLQRRTRDSLSSLWPLCQKLSLLARSGVRSELMTERIADVSGQLEELARNAGSTRDQLAHITLGATELEINVATEQVGAMKWQVNEMQKLDQILEGG
jgi:hypothetical protein